MKGVKIKMTKRRVVVTGIGAVTPLGNDVKLHGKILLQENQELVR